jgi:hypothetical protein
MRQGGLGRAVQASGSLCPARPRAHQRGCQRLRDRYCLDSRYDAALRRMKRRANADETERIRHKFQRRQGEVAYFY